MSSAPVQRVASLCRTGVRIPCTPEDIMVTMHRVNGVRLPLYLPCSQHWLSMPVFSGLTRLHFKPTTTKLCEEKVTDYIPLQWSQISNKKNILLPTQSNLKHCQAWIYGGGLISVNDVDMWPGNPARWYFFFTGVVTDTSSTIIQNCLTWMVLLRGAQYCE